MQGDGNAEEGKRDADLGVAPVERAGEGQGDRKATQAGAGQENNNSNSNEGNSAAGQDDQLSDGKGHQTKQFLAMPTTTFQQR